MHQGSPRLRLLVFTLSATISLIACSSDNDASTTPAPVGAAPPPASGTNKAPMISGMPPTSALVDRAYLFTPLAADSNGDALTFKVANAPAWTAFDARSGQLTGAPTVEHVGTYANITITVSDGSAEVSLAPFSITVTPVATGSATLSWLPSTEQTSGDPLTNLAGTNIYWGTEIGSYPNSVKIRNSGITRYVIDQLTPATWYFVVTAVDAAGVESSFSNVASKTIR